MNGRSSIGAGLALVLVLSTSTPAQRREMQKTIIQGDTMYTLMEPGGIPAIFEPQFKPVSEATEDFAVDEPLLVVQVGNDVRAYSTWHLDEHEIVNDWFGELPLAVTW